MIMIMMGPILIMRLIAMVMILYPYNLKELPQASQLAMTMVMILYPYNLKEFPQASQLAMQNFCVLVGTLNPNLVTANLPIAMKMKNVQAVRLYVTGRIVAIPKEQ